MKTLLWIGNPFFSSGLARHGWRAVCHVPGKGEFFTWSDCARLAGGEPDVLVVGDTSCPPFVLGVENFPCLTVFYAVDTHIHSWMPLYGQAFDACLISLRDHMARFRGKRLPDERLWWSPPYAPDATNGFPGEARQWDCLFVGTADPATTPLRCVFLEELRALVPGLHARRGNFLELYPRARTLINFCEHGDLNFRVFEAMGCGTALITPRVGHGQGELFTSGRHLLTFDVPPQNARNAAAPDGALPDDERGRAAARLAAAQAAPLILDLLARPARREALARAGWEEINARHRAAHRAEALAGRLRALPPDLPSRRRKEAAAIREHYLKLMYLLWGESLPDSPIKRAYLAAAMGRAPA